MKFTEKNTAALRLPAGKADSVHWDDDLPGFGIRLREGGSRTWLFRYRIGKKQRAVKLGSAKTIPLVVARKNAKKLAGRVVNGEDPALDREIARSEAENTFGVLANQFLEARKSSWRPRTYEELRRHLIKKSKSLHSLPVTAISQRNIANLLAEVTKNGPIESNRLRATLSTFFGWIMREGIRLPEGNPAAHTNKNEERSRDRVFTDAELRAIWNACLGDDYGAVIKLLMLTGQRANEISALRWSEVHDEQIVLPGERTKNHRVHIVPLSEPAKAILAGLPAAGRQFVFGLTDVRGFCGWSAAKDNLNARIAQSGSALPHWTPHDLRRTAATRMSELGVQPHVVEAVLNHVSGHKAGVAGIYNRASYDKEKREALNLWAEHVTALVEGRKATVVPMKRA